MFAGVTCAMEKKKQFQIIEHLIMLLKLTLIYIGKKMHSIKLNKKKMLNVIKINVHLLL